MDTAPGNGIASLARAERFLERNRFRPALAEYEAVLVADPENVPARLGKAICLLGLKRNEEGQRLLAELDPIEDPVLRSRRLRGEAWGLLREKQWQRALDWIDEHLAEVEDRKSRMLLLRAIALVQLGRRTEAGQPLRAAWRSFELEVSDLHTVTYLAPLANEPALGRQAAATLLRSRYFLGAALSWALLILLESHILLVRAPIFILLFFAPLVVFGPLEVVAGWAVFGLICAAIGTAHRMPVVTGLGVWTALLFGGSTGLIFLVTDPTLSGWTCAALVLIGVPAVALALRRANRRYRQRKAAAQQAGLGEARPTPLADPPVAPPAHSRNAWQYLVWPVVILVFALLVCRSSSPTATERMQQVFEGIEPERVAWQYVSYGQKGLDAAVFLLDLKHTSVGDRTDFSAVLLNRGDAPIEGVSIYLTLFAADGGIVDIVPMAVGPGPIVPGARVPLSTSFDPDLAPPEILEEYLAPPFGPSFRVDHVPQLAAEPSVWMVWVGESVPGLEYSAVWTRPHEPWVVVDVEVVLGGSP